MLLRLEAHLHDVRAAAQRLQDVLDRVRQRSGRFADGGQALGLEALLVELGVLNRHARLQADRGEQAQLVGGVGVILHGAVDVDHADDLVAAPVRIEPSCS